MLSALVLAPPFSGTTAPAPGLLVRTLSALVPATIEGLVRDVTVLSGPADDAVQTVAEHAGCRLLEADRFETAITEGLRLAKSPSLFVLRAGASFDRGFLDEVAAVFAPGQAAEAGPYLIRQSPEGFAARIMPGLAPVAGLIAPRAQLSGQAADFAALVRKVGRGRPFGARAVMAAA